MQFIRSIHGTFLGIYTAAHISSPLSFKCAQYRLCFWLIEDTVCFSRSHDEVLNRFLENMYSAQLFAVTFLKSFLSTDILSRFLDRSFGSTICDLIVFSNHRNPSFHEISNVDSSTSGLFS